MDDAPAGDEARRRALLERARSVWIEHLLDTGHRNNLLFYRDLRAGTLDVGRASDAVLERLLRGDSVRLSQLFADDLSDALRRARAVKARATEHEEERGIKTLSLGCALATWENTGSAAVPSAPVLLRPLTMTPRSGARTDFDLQLEGDMEVNPTLLHVLHQQFGVTVDRGALDGRLDGEIDTPRELHEAYEWLSEIASSVPGFAIDERIVIANFSYAKLPMVQDLEQSQAGLAENELIAAIAGDEAARAVIRERQGHGTVDVASPNHVPPADEFLILDADSSQNYAINAVIAGRDLIVKGPPGTGKSQTISNLVATLVARGKTVLFVAEKRAAIDAVAGRLERAGLDDLVFDLHSQTGSRRLVASHLARSLTTIRDSVLEDRSQELARLEASRTAVLEHDSALHDPRMPWGVTVFDAQAELTGLASAATPVRFRGDTLRALDERAVDALRGRLQRFVALGGTSTTLPSRPWASSLVRSDDDARRAFDLVADLLHRRVPAVRAVAGRPLSRACLPEPPTLAGWSSAVALLEAMEAVRRDLRPEAFETDLGPLVATLSRSGLGRAMSGLFSSEFRRARARGQELVADPTADTDTQITRLRGAHDCIARWVAAGGSLPPVDVGELDGASAAVKDLMAGAADLSTLVGYDVSELSMAELDTRLAALAGDESTLSSLPELHELRAELDALGLGELLPVLGDATPDKATDTFRYAWLSSILDDVRFSDRRLGAFSAAAADHALSEFQRRDGNHIHTSAARVRRRYAEAATRARDLHPDQADLLENQANRKRGHLPLRQLVARAPDVLLALKPCWAMSPLLVSQVLPADLRFDVVVFDEASQVTPADAIPSILRGSRVVVAGDDRQLPPTAFFMAATPEEEDEELENDSAITAISGFESILDVLSALVSFRMLAWHYRSQDERLIAFSNMHVYDRGMTTFPGVGGGPPIRHVLVDGVPTVGSEKSSAAEVDAVVRLVLEHAETRSDESLGVIALGIAHADRIGEAIRRALLERRDLDSFFNEANDERFFVKNLERVQGDERDAIILSLGYAKDADGRLRHHFGPINLEGGERRLNVAVTRARRAMTLVSSFSATDIDPARSSAVGVRLLRQYLQYAESGGEFIGDDVPTYPALNPFEIDVRDTLARLGVPVIPQLGCSGYRIDFAAQHPERPGDFVLAIECDGAAYHSSATARDRDRLRQEQLERLGWRFHRIWSTDWFRDKDAAATRALTEWQRAVAESDAAPEARTSAPLTVEGPAATPLPSPDRQGSCPVPPGRSIADYSGPELRAVVRWVSSDTRLRTEGELLNDVMVALGFRRRGTRIVSAIEQAIRAERR